MQTACMVLKPAHQRQITFTCYWPTIYDINTLKYVCLPEKRLHSFQIRKNGNGTFLWFSDGKKRTVTYWEGRTCHAFRVVSQLYVHPELLAWRKKSSATFTGKMSWRKCLRQMQQYSYVAQRKRAVPCVLVSKEVSKSCEQAVAIGAGERKLSVSI